MESTQVHAYQAPQAWRRLDVLAASIVINLLALALPIVVLQVYDRILPNFSYDTLGVLISALVVVAVLDGLFGYARALILTRSGAKFEYTSNLAAMSAVLSADLARFESDSQGAHLERFQGIETIRDFYHGPSMLLVVDLPFVLLFLALIWQFSGAMVLIPLAMIFVFATISFMAGLRLRSAIRTRSEHHERRQNFVIECLQGMHTIKSLAMEQQMMRRFERLQTNSADSVYALAHINSIVHGLAATFSQAVMIAFVAIGSIKVVEGNLSVGALAAGTMLAGRVLQPALRALSFWTYRQTVNDKEEKLAELIEMEPEAFHADAERIGVKGKIELRGIDFRYDENSDLLLKDINLVIEPGEAISIRGPNGAGKSTLLNLIMGFITPERGEILIDDINIRDLDRSSLRSQIGLVPQHGVLFNGTLIDNMTLFQDGDAAAEAVELSRALGLADDIVRLPDGLDTVVNSNVSHGTPQGFAQRVVAVRALIGKLSIILFDDANLGFDQRNDDYLRDLLAERRGDHTLIIVSHRPSLQRLCDRHFELHAGRLLVSSGAFQGKRPEDPQFRVVGAGKKA